MRQEGARIIKEAEKVDDYDGDLEKLKHPASAGIFGVNSTESNREQNGIIRGQIWDV